MTNGLLGELTTLLESNDKLLVEGFVNKNLVAELARKYDADLLNSLQELEGLRSMFFAETNNGIIFKKDIFLEFLSNKEFLPDSYTRFRAKIGLGSENGSLLTEFGDVVLNWPYKDAILEGDQSTEDARREEVYFNEILASEQLTRLLDKKAFTNWTRYSADGTVALEDLEEGDNLVLKGNNLVVLHSLKERLAAKVDFIYIDPPYNTGSDGFDYNDRFNHATWLTFMKNRLEVAKDMLTLQGAIAISIDDNEAAYLKVLMDNLFGRENFLATIGYERSGVSGIGQGGKFLVNTHESILCYARSESHFRPNNLYDNQTFEPEAMKRYNQVLIDAGQREEVARFVAPSTGQDVVIYKHTGYKTESISLANFQKNKESILAQYVAHFDRVYRTTSVQAENEFQNKILGYTKDGLYSADYLVSRGKRAGENLTNYYQNGQVFVWLNDTATCEDGEILRTGKLSQFWTHASIPKADLANEGGVNLRRGKKPERLLKRLLEIFTRPGDLVLDYHLGSGTTAAVAHKMGRQYVGIEQLDYGQDDATIRLKNVIDGDSTGVSRHVDWKGGGSFVYAKIVNNAEEFRARVVEAQGSKELTALFKEAAASSFLSYRVNPKKMSTPEFNALNEAQKKELLLQLVDGNTLYVNYDDFSDSRYKTNLADKKFTGQLYAKN